MFPLSKNITAAFSVIKSFSRLNLCSVSKTNVIPALTTKVKSITMNQFHTSHTNLDLMEFFDDKDNWGAQTVKVGRSWKKEELRIKSNSDLHKLWFVLLKEKNMLLTMEHEANERVKLFPNPERLDKVNESMENLEFVVRERNRAYFELETGETGEQGGDFAIDPLGRRRYYKFVDHPYPKYYNGRRNTKFFSPAYSLRGIQNFQKLYREKLFVEKRRARNRQYNHVVGLLKRFPHLDIEALKANYPDVDIEKAMKSKKTRGHHEHNRV